MRIAVIGAGNVGGSLGRGWSKRGHQVRYGVPNPADAKYRDLPTATPAVAAADADAIVLATPWPATEAAVRGLGDLSGRLVIDCTNPLAEAAAEARYLILLFAETSEARNPRRQELIAKVLDDLARLSD